MFPESPTEKIKVIADSVLRLSDYYIQNPESETPWREKFCQIAYRYYFLPLNFIRIQKVIERGQQVGFFSGLNTFLDWGCGPGTASLALATTAELRPQIESQLLYDLSPVSLEAFSDLHSFLKNPKKLQQLNLNQIQGKSACLVFSYSLTEVSELPAGWQNFEALMIAEPSTSEDGRKLMQLRSELISAGFHIWAPCTHHEACPLLTQSKHDWCHDRAKVTAPAWFNQVEQMLPMKNKTITVSYLLARKTKSADMKALARLTGDSLEEKGKTRQLMCRGPEREFLTWMHKSIETQVLPRGELIYIPENAEKKSNELRLSEEVKVFDHGKSF